MNAQALADVRTLVEQGESAHKARETVGQRYGVSGRTIQRWATAAGEHLGDVTRDTAKKAREVQAERNAFTREQLRAGLLRAAVKAVGEIERRLDEEDARGAQGLAVLLGVLVDKMRLEEGEATSRSESFSLDEFARGMRQLEAELDRAGIPHSPLE